MKHKLIYDEVFRAEVLFYLCDNGDDALKHANKKYNAKISDASFDGFQGTCMELFNTKTKITSWFVWIKYKDDWKTMTHETSHLVFRILDNRGVKYSSDNDETWCYLHEYFIGKFWHEMCK